ncbi:ADP-ribosylglycohydrolase family protein [Nonomuraea antimicrobica]|uniref:ADP-ribosylglycohydrolase family protein n=1 Tax=Nonomuraea antimicrobica TaxID=561173 RepID=UPI0031F0E83B
MLRHTPQGPVRDGIALARRLLTISDPVLAARRLGNGRAVSAQDTIPFTLWAAARHLNDYAAAFWTTAAAGGDVDTTCAIVGGIVGARTPPPPEWLRQSEPPPAWADVPPPRWADAPTTG